MSSQKTFIGSPLKVFLCGSMLSYMRLHTVHINPENPPNVRFSVVSNSVTTNPHLHESQFCPKRSIFMMLLVLKTYAPFYSSCISSSI